jgi:hypothetical protein
MKETPDDEIDPNFKKIFVNWEDDEEDNPPAQPEPEDDPPLTLGIEPMDREGEKLSFVVTLEDEDDGQYLLLQPEAESEYRHTLPWLSILSLAGARTFANPDLFTIFADPRGSWVDLYFERLPAAIADAAYAQLIWNQYSSIDLWLKDTASGELLASLRFTPPAPPEYEAE